ncbi:MAG TPA: tRNA 2-thiouridine(34) synthase MnmA [Candidatus Nanoarchaeia archaeon]|nr:tRNA 2-thiouridine(34) synthase MnmA [Candidatus Nanoarchaeia archaeon]
MEKQKFVLLGLSGGVDSAVAALLLKKQGYHVIGAFIKSFSETKNKLTNECNWVEEKRMAQKMAAHLQIPFIVLDFEKAYTSQVIKPMIKAYKEGITPNPDIACNTLIKFPLLWKAARKLKADYIATGHYARIKKTKNTFELHQGRDKSKDQSYFLCELSRRDLSHTLFPVGNHLKSQVKQIAKKNNFPNYDKPSTKGICFVGNIPLKSFLEKRLRKKSGVVLNDRGQIIGKHDGAHYYTLGERVRPTIGINIIKGVSSQKRFYIAKKDMEKNTITVVPENHLLLKHSAFNLKKVHWINSKDKKIKLRAKVRVRHLGKLMPSVLKIKRGRLQFTLGEPASGIAPGQSAVFYQGTRIVCGGEISL